jgi:hypothetical protein
MQLQPVFEAALASHFDPPVTAKGLSFAIEWLTLPVSYSEMQLTNVFTALEHLISTNLPQIDSHFLPKGEFKMFAKRLRQFARDDYASSTANSNTELKANIAAMHAAFPAKIQDINRRSLFDRIMKLAEIWHVPLEGLVKSDVQAAIKARNKIVHQGFYYGPGHDPREQVDLRDHILLIREVAIRFVLTLIGYKGTYLSFRNGQHDVDFPHRPKK